MASVEEKTGPDTEAPSVPKPALAAPRRVSLAVSRIDPLSAMKIGFLVAVALTIVTVVATIVLWFVLDMLHVFSSLQGFMEAIGGSALLSIVDMLHFSRLIALVTIVCVVQVVIFSVLCWLAALIYNLIARMVGGLHVTLVDE